MKPLNHFNFSISAGVSRFRGQTSLKRVKWGLNGDFKEAVKEVYRA